MTLAPHSEAAERELLGSMLLDSTIADRALSTVPREDLYLPASGAIWDAIAAVRAKGLDSHDVYAVVAAMTEAGTGRYLDNGASTLVGLMGAVLVAELWEQQAAAVRAKARLRRLALACSDAIAASHTASDASEILEDLGATVARLAMGADSRLVSAADVMPEVFATLEARVKARRDGGDQYGGGVTFGVHALDEIVCGLRPGQLVVVAAETSGGKTALAQQAGIRCVASGGSVLNFNLEMTRSDLVERALSYLGEINSQRLRVGWLDGSDWNALTSAAAHDWMRRYYLEDQVFRPADIAAKARVWRGRHAALPGLIIVDFLQLVDCPQSKGETRTRAVGAVAQALKVLAKQLEVPVIAVSQINRTPLNEQRPPRKSDLRDSGEIENSADIILFTHDPSVAPPSEDRDEPVPMQFIVAKNRNGLVAQCEGIWIKKNYAFRDLYDNRRETP